MVDYMNEEEALVACQVTHRLTGLHWSGKHVYHYPNYDEGNPYADRNYPVIRLVQTKRPRTKYMEYLCRVCGAWVGSKQIGDRAHGQSNVRAD